MILIDNNQVIIANIFSMMKHNNEFDESFLRHMILNTYRMYRKKFKKRYGELIICNDSRNSWRKDFFPHYKANRKKQRDKSDMDWNQIHDIMNQIRAEIEEVFPYKVLQLQGAEADDIIAVLCKQYWQAENIVIVSSDKDFQQLQIFPSVKQFSPVKRDMLICDNPKSFLFEHIVRGDTSDGIPNALSDDDVFVSDEKRQKRITKKVLEEANLEFTSGNIEKWNNWHRNQVLIDFKYIPEKLESDVIEQFNKEIDISRGKIFPYMIEHRLSNLMDCIEDF